MKRLPTIILLLCGASLLFACEETPPDNIINQLDRPGALGLVCYSEDTTGAFERAYPLDCCRVGSQGVAGYCSGPLDLPQVATFLTQTTTGEVAVLSEATGDIVDQDLSIPLNSFIPVGGQPSDLAVSWDGERVYTANIETADLSVIQVSDSFGPRMVPAKSIGVDYPAARIELSPEPYRDRVAFVTQPTEDRLAVVALHPEDCPNDPGGSIPGCLLGHLPLTTAVAAEVFPTAMALSVETGLLYVAGGFAPVLYEIDSVRLAEEALGLTEPGELSDVSIVREISTDVYLLSRISVEPELFRYLYGIEAQGGGIVVVDLNLGDLVDVAADDPDDPTPFTLNLPGRADSLTLERLTDSADPNPLTFNGSFAFVAASDANLYVIDVQDMDNPGSESHVLRSAVSFSGGNFEPRIDPLPTLSVDGQLVSATQAEGYVTITARDDLVLSCEEGAYYQPTDDNGFHLSCNPRNTVNDLWRATWQGAIGATGAALVDYDFGEAATAFEVRDPNRNFTTAGVLAGSGVATACGIDPFVIPDNYTGDWFEIALTPEQEEDPDCAEFAFRPLVYQVVQIVDDNTLLLSVFNFDNPAPLPTKACFGPAFNYEIRAFGHWVLAGFDTGIDHRGCPQRIWPDGATPFENRYFSFVLTNGLEAPTESMVLLWETAGGFRPLRSFLGDFGNKVNDIVLTPGSNLIMVDQATDRLVVFDLLGEFAITATPPL